MSDTTFETIVSRLDYPMVVVTTVHGGARAGCLVGFHSQCSIDPPRYAVWISKVNHTARVAMRARTFALHFLDDTPASHDLAELFGGHSDDSDDKFAQCAWHEGPDGVPLLDACPTRVVGRRASLLDDTGDHACFVLVPFDGTATDAFAPLMYSEVRGMKAGHEVA
jgi:flavin reductase (DIM6/NTAB) family NADH-FMN oxidoreductase RutF